MSNSSVRSYRVRLRKGGFSYEQISSAVWSLKEGIRTVILGGYFDDTSFSGRQFGSKTSGDMQT